MLDQIDVAFLEDLHRAWANAPPLRRMVATYLGYKRRETASRDYRDLLAMFPHGAIR